MKSFLDGKVTLHQGDCLEVLRDLEPDSIDSCVTDPPYHLVSIVKRFGAENAAWRWRWLAQTSAPKLALSKIR